MKINKAYLLLALTLTSEFSFAEVDKLAEKLVSYSDCKKTFEEGMPTIKISPTPAEEYEYDKARTCDIWAIATIVALQSAGKMCPTKSYEIVKRVISYAYEDLPSKDGKNMVWTYAKVAMHMYPCEPSIETNAGKK